MEERSGRPLISEGSICAESTPIREKASQPCVSRAGQEVSQLTCRGTGDWNGGLPVSLETRACQRRQTPNLQGAEKPRKKGARCQSSAAASWPLPSTSEAAEACESLPSPGSLGTCFTYVPFKATGDLRQLEHNQTSENKKHGHEDAIPRQNITA